MVIDSKECTDGLNKYKVQTDIERIAIKVLLAKDDTYIPAFQAMDGVQLRSLKAAIRVIRNTMGIEEIA